MAKYEYQRKGFQPIPTPEEEARDDLRAQGNKSSSRAMVALSILIGCAMFHSEIETAAAAIWRFFT